MTEYKFRPGQIVKHKAGVRKMVVLETPYTEKDYPNRPFEEERYKCQYQLDVVPRSQKPISATVTELFDEIALEDWKETPDQGTVS